MPNKPIVHTNLTATTYGLGPFHPAIRCKDKVWYWPDITSTDEQDAADWAQARLSALMDESELQNYVDEWDIRPA